MKPTSRAQYRCAAATAACAAALALMVAGGSANDSPEGAADARASGRTTARLPAAVARRLTRRGDIRRTSVTRGTSLAAGQVDAALVRAWSYTRGRTSAGEPVLVAVVDSGVDTEHPNLRDAIWTNPGEIPGNGRDDDANGFVDDVNGADMVDPGASIADPYGHGTEVAGLIAARPDPRDSGVTGVANEARVMAVRVLDAEGRGDSSQLAQGITYAAANGARVINVSVNTSANAADLAAAVAFAARQGAVVVASAGNDARDLDAVPSYPAADPSPALVSVAALDDAGQLAWFSNFGAQAVDVAAPGVAQMTLAPQGHFALFSGTSAAAAYVSGVVALMRAASESAAPEQIRDALLSTSSGGAGLRIGAGAVAPDHAVAAVASLPPARAAMSVRVASRRARRGRRVDLRLSVEGAASDSIRCTLELRPAGAAAKRTRRVAVRMRGSTGRVRATLARGVSRVAAIVTCAGPDGTQTAQARLVLRRAR